MAARRNGPIDQTFESVCVKLQAHNKELNKAFNEMTTNFDRFRFVWSLGIVHQEIDAMIDAFEGRLGETGAKDVARASALRKEGNEMFKAKQFEIALDKYTASIRHAVNPLLVGAGGSSQPTAAELDELSLAYANRSAVFFHLNEFELCLNDIEQAFKFKYPANLRSKLVERKLQSLLKLGKGDEIERLLAKVEELGLEPKSAEVYQAKLAGLKSKPSPTASEPADGQFKAPTEGYLYEKVPMDLQQERQNKSIQFASDRINIGYAPDRGFHMKAVSEIGVGEILLDEPPYASVLFGSNVDQFCLECMQALDPYKMNVTPCRQCTLVTFCSRRCEKLAWTHHHRFECRCFRLLAFESGLSYMEWLSLRIVLKAKYDCLAELKPRLLEYEQEFEHLPGRHELSNQTAEKQIYRSDAYMNVFSLMTNSFLRKPNHLFKRTFTAAFLTKILIRQGFFGKQTQEAMREEACFVGGLLLRHSQSISCNAHEISRLIIAESGKDAMARSTANGIGAGLFPVLSIFNHSCDPHVTRAFKGTRCQVRTIQVVRAGEEIFDNYGVVYAVNTRNERHEKLLEQYFFECRCQACKSDWPLYDQIRSELKLSDVKCPACLKSGKQAPDCAACIKEFDELRLFQLAADQSLQLLLRVKRSTNIRLPSVRKQLESMYTSFCTYLERLEGHKIGRPFREYNNYQEALKQCLNLINII